MKIEHIIKRDFTTTVYDLNKIIDAIEKAMSIGKSKATREKKNRT